MHLISSYGKGLVNGAPLASMGVLSLLITVLVVVLLVALILRVAGR